MTSTQNKIIHAELNKAGLMSRKADIIASFTQGRTSHSSEMNVDEARVLIGWLRNRNLQGSSACKVGQNLQGYQPKPGDKMRKRLISMAYELHWASPGDWKAAISALDKFLTSPKSIFKKPLNKHSVTELTKVVTQMEQIYKKHLSMVGKPIKN